MTASDLLAMGESKFVSLTTFRKTGVPVSTAVWIARDGDELVVTTPGGSGKVKRLRHTSRIELRPCSRMGKVEPDAPVAVGSARLEDTDAARERGARGEVRPRVQGDPRRGAHRLPRRGARDRAHRGRGVSGGSDAVDAAGAAAGADAADGAGPAGASGAAGRIVVLPGATGVTGRAVASALTASGATVIALGTDTDRLATVDAAERAVVDLLDADATVALAASVLERHGRVDGLVHLVGGWKPGWSDEVTDWLNARLVTTLLNATTAFEPVLLAAPDARLALVSSTAVTREGPPTSAYAAAKLAAESWVEQVAGRWADTDAAAVTWVVRSLGDGERDTAPTAVADAALHLWDVPASELNGTRIRL